MLKLKVEVSRQTLNMLIDCIHVDTYDCSNMKQALYTYVSVIIQKKLILKTRMKGNYIKISLDRVECIVVYYAIKHSKNNDMHLTDLLIRLGQYMPVGIAL
jgi:hypothetical protein